MKAVQVICQVSVSMTMFSILLYVSAVHWFYGF